MGAEGAFLICFLRDLKGRAAPGGLLLGIGSRQEKKVDDPLVATLGCDMDGAHGLRPFEKKTAAGHLLLVHIHLPKVIGPQPRAYLLQSLHLHQLSLCKIGRRVDVNLLIVKRLLVTITGFGVNLF